MTDSCDVNADLPTKVLVPRSGRRAGQALGIIAAVIATALAWSGLSLRDVLATLFP